MDEGIIIPVALFLAIAATVIAFFIYRHRSFVAAQNTLTKLVDSNQALTPELIQSVGIKAAPTPFADLRRGILLIAFGIATALFGQFIPEDEAGQVFLGLASFPVFLGIGFFISHYLGKKDV